MLDQHPSVADVIAAPTRWHAVRHHEEVTSTNDLAAEAMARGVAPGLVVTADRQTAGRGRRGRTWEDQPAGRSLAISATVSVPERPTLVPLAAGLAVAEAYEGAGGRPRLKWPNDVLLGRDVEDERKAAGILVERRDPVLVVGMGLNLDWRGVVRDEASVAWTSLAETLADDREIDRGQVLADLLRVLDRRLHEARQDPARLLGDYRERCATLGRRVRVLTPAGDVDGEVEDIGDDGALVLRTGTGRQVITAGDVVHVR